MIIPATYENLQVTHEGTMSKRAYYIPASTKRDDLVEHRERSDRFQLLNGDWKFKYYSNVHDLTDLFYKLGFGAEDYDTLPVPSGSASALIVTAPFIWITMTLMRTVNQRRNPLSR